MAKTKLTPETHKIIVKSVREHGFISVAARAAGITPDTLNNWLERGAAEEEPFYGFSIEVAKAKAQRIEEGVKRVKGHAQDNYQAETWLLSHVDHETFGAKNKTEISGPGGAGIAIVFEGMDKEKGEK